MQPSPAMLVGCSLGWAFRTSSTKLSFSLPTTCFEKLTLSLKVDTDLQQTDHQIVLYALIKIMSVYRKQIKIIIAALPQRQEEIWKILLL